MNPSSHNTELQNALAKLPDILKNELDEPLCVCNQVSKINIIHAIAQGADSLDKLAQSCYAGDGNGCCKRQLSRLIECICSEKAQ